MVAAVCVVVLISSACRTLQVTSSVPHDQVVVGDKTTAAVEGGTALGVAPGIADVPVQLLREGVVVAQGTVARDNMMVPLVVAACATAALCAPASVVAAVCITNPFLLAGSTITALGALTVVGPCTACSAFSSFSWLTLPCMGLGLVGGISPLVGGLLLARTTPEAVEIAAPAPAASAASAPTGVAW
jgi:hypothetical protein